MPVGAEGSVQCVAFRFFLGNHVAMRTCKRAARSVILEMLLYMCITSFHNLSTFKQYQIDSINPWILGHVSPILFQVRAPVVAPQMPLGGGLAAEGLAARRGAWRLGLFWRAFGFEETRSWKQTGKKQNQTVVLEDFARFFGRCSN